MYRSCQVIRSILNSKGKSISVAYVTKTDSWERLYLAQSIQDELLDVAEKYKDTIKDETVKIAMKEAEHPSHSDTTKHFTVFELDKNDKVVASQHYYK